MRANAGRRREAVADRSPDWCQGAVSRCRRGSQHQRFLRLGPNDRVGSGAAVDEHTYQRRLAGFSPRSLETSARSPSKLRRMSVGSVDSQMPPDGQPPSIRNAADAARPRRRAPARHPRAQPGRRRDFDKAAGLAGGHSGGEAVPATPALEQLPRHPRALQKPACEPSQRSNFRHQGLPSGRAAKLPGGTVYSRCRHILRHEKPLRSS